MNIGRQWEDRLKIWSEQFSKHYFRKYDALAVSYFTTMEHLAFDDAVNGPFAPAPVGTKWGKKWEYGWFRTSIVIPEDLQGQRVVFTLKTAEEMLVWVNGREAGAIDKHHKFITLSRCANAGETYEIYAECYAGHGLRNEGAGPVAFGEESVPEPPAQQVTVGESTYGIWNEALFQVAMDYLTLYSLVQKLPEKSLRAMKIIEGLKKFTYIADFELPEPALTASLVEADKHLKPLLACHNGSTAPEYTVFGQSHLDMAWLWTVEETMRKTARTYSNQLALMEEYPDYEFLMCEPPIAEYLKALYPNVWERVRHKVDDGAIQPEGAMWIECDTNIPSGESLIRQFIRGKRWYWDELGINSRMAWMPDTFGFSAALPQIMKKCQVHYFATQKLMRQDPEAEPFPYNVFWWEGVDGSKVLSHLFKKNNAVFQAGDLITRWESDRIQTENIDGLMYPFGYGDGGGGPTREMVEMAARCADLEGAPRCRMENPVKFFERQENVENTYRGELYLAWHRGTLTAQAKTKRFLRQAEATLKKVEFLMARRLLQGDVIPNAWKEKLDELWKKLLFNQFHDIATGASIRAVHARAVEELLQILAEGEELIAEMVGVPGEVETVYNHLGWPIRYLGTEIPAQSCAVLQPHSENKATACRYETQDGAYFELYNQHLICRVSELGELLSVKDHAGREFLSGTGNRLLMYKDVNTCYDAWELGSMYENLPVELDEAADVQIMEDEEGAALLVQRKLHDSMLMQKILLGHDAVRLDFVTTLNWNERHKLLKTAFLVNAYANEAIHEIQFGYLKRPTHRSKQSDKDRYEVCNHRYTAITDGALGAAVLNDCKYGVSTHGSEIRLTLLRAPMMPDMYADLGYQQFTYSFCPFTGSFTHSDVLRQASELNEPPITGAFCDRVGSIFLSRSKNIIVDTIKPADTVENALLVRVYEAMGMATDAEFDVHPDIHTITETDMLELNPEEMPFEDALRVHFGPFEIKTFILYL